MMVQVLSQEHKFLLLLLTIQLVLFTVTFGTTPDANPTLDYLYGEPGQDWRLMVKQNTKDNVTPTPSDPFGSTLKECILHNTGLSGAENVLIGFREWQYPTSNAYGWDFNRLSSIH